MADFLESLKEYMDQVDVQELNISTDDYVVEGIVKDEFDLSELQSKYQVFKVVSVDDNRKGGSQHYKIGVSE